MLPKDHPLIGKMLALAEDAEEQGVTNVCNGIMLIVRGALNMPTSVGRYAINAGHLVMDTILLAQRLQGREPIEFNSDHGEDRFVKWYLDGPLKDRKRGCGRYGKDSKE